MGGSVCDHWHPQAPVHMISGKAETFYMRMTILWHESFEVMLSK